MQVIGLSMHFLLSILGLVYTDMIRRYLLRFNINQI